MTKDILVCIKGMQLLSDDQEDEVEVIIPGKYCKRGDMHYIQYEEVTEGMDGVTNNLIKFHGNCMEVTKKGLTNTHMVFEEQKKNMWASIFREEGREEGRRVTAFEMKNDGIPIEKIMQYTKLPREMIESL